MDFLETGLITSRVCKVLHIIACHKKRLLWERNSLPVQAAARNVDSHGPSHCPWLQCNFGMSIAMFRRVLRDGQKLSVVQCLECR